MEQNSSYSRFTSDQRIALTLCIAVLSTWLLSHAFLQSPGNSDSPVWLQPLAAVLSVTGIILVSGNTRLQCLWQTMFISGLLLMVWASNGVIFDLLTMAGLIGDPATGLRARVNWSEAVMRVSAFAAAITIARLALRQPVSSVSSQSTKWYGYAAFILALPYPVLRIWWALGGTPGLTHANAAGEGFAPVILAIPWILAAILSLFLVSDRTWMPRRLILIAGWTATAIVASVAPAACWSLVTKFISHDQFAKNDMATWVFCLFYGSWLFWAIAAFAATRSYQLKSMKKSQILQDQESMP